MRMGMVPGCACAKALVTSPETENDLSGSARDLREVSCVTSTSLELTRQHSDSFHQNRCRPATLNASRQRTASYSATPSSAKLLNRLSDVSRRTHSRRPHGPIE